VEGHAERLDIVWPDTGHVFALNQWLQYRAVGRRRAYLFGERIYILLSLTGKSALAWQIFAGTLAAEPRCNGSATESFGSDERVADAGAEASV
jgi:hypothetical protein